MATAIGIDLGTHAVKLALLEGRPGKMEQVDYHIQLVPQDAENPPTLDARLAALKMLLDGLDKMPGGTWSAAYPTESASLRTVVLPFTDRGQIEKTIEFEIENYVPFKLPDFVLDYRVIDQEGGRSKVLAALAERDGLAATLDGLSEMGLDPRHMMLDAEPLAGLAGGTGCKLVVDVGHSRTLVALAVDGQLMDARAISFGGRDLTLAICQQLGLSWGESELAKHRAQLGGGADSVVIEWEEEGDGEQTDSWFDDVSPTNSGVDVPENPLASGEPKPVAPAAPNLAAKKPSTKPTVTVEGALLTALGPMVSSLRATLLSFEARLDRDVEAVVLTGGSADLGGFSGWLSGAIELPVEVAEVSDEARRQGGPGRFALCHCLAARSAGGSRIRELEFRKEEFAFHGDLARLSQWAGVAATAMVVFCAAAVVMFGVRYQQLSAAVETLDGQIAGEVQGAFPGVADSAVSTPMAARAVVVEKSSEAITRVESLGSVVGGEPPILTLVKEISQGLPPTSEARVEVTELKLSDKSVQLKAQTTGFEAAAAIETSLKRNERFVAAIKGDEKKRGDELTFTITIPLEVEDEEEEEG